MRGVKIMVQNKCLGCDVCVCVCTWKGWEDKGVFVCISLCRAGDLSTVFTLDVKNQNQDICGLQKSMIQKENASHAVMLKKKGFYFICCADRKPLQPRSPFITEARCCLQVLYLNIITLQPKPCNNRLILLHIKGNMAEVDRF